MENQASPTPIQEPISDPITVSPLPPKDNHTVMIASMAVFTLLTLSAAAFLYYQNQQLKNMLASYQTPVSSPTPLVSPEPSAQAETANWKTYTNSKYGFSFKYPGDWEVKTTLENFKFVIGPSSELTTYLTKINEQKVIYLMMSGPGQTTLTTSEWKKGGYQVGETQNEINGLAVTSRIFTKSDTYQKEVEIVLPGQKYNTAFDIYNKSLESTLDQILSTFQFTK
jgi:hypothetical protein